MLPHHQNVEREGGKGGEEGREWGAQERRDKIEKPRSKRAHFEAQFSSVMILTRKHTQLQVSHYSLQHTPTDVLSVIFEPHFALALAASALCFTPHLSHPPRFPLLRLVQGRTHSPHIRLNRPPMSRPLAHGASLAMRAATQIDDFDPVARART